MSDFHEQIRREIIESIHKTMSRQGIRIHIKDLPDMLRGAMDNVGTSTNIVQPSGGGHGHGKFILSIHNVKVVKEIMQKIWQRYNVIQQKYYGRVLGIRQGVKTSTGQTLGNIRGDKGTRDSAKINDNVVEFQFLAEERLGDKQARARKARDNQWKAKRQKANENRVKRGEKPKPVYPSTKIQRGPRAGQPWKPKQYNEVAKHIEEMKKRPIMFTDLEAIKLLVINAMLDKTQ